ncbi:ring-cleaving dioxygenase [Carnobacterium divergens]|uniref:Ring-cleaving dioxygenase n=1 Tax=Carnobacterium divergens TaxID=2748 RepID=A0A7Z8G527_CARDV|nr:ring-cleaving dioxygenase [Carnobacterium divergens]TFI73460.1 ring-cleaving dioxygenase [Carnobacterium divergens]TFI77407.1 ring-cleaving dioxygenase [Carnobacterium divergens]TFI84171.1 ring-cleaving dioxygenase [Carnobacterium divergens]TFI96017.1 ring-cleaving dioxygenase [Carnobacterium divergens]TFJ12320.1 ring-cleaving dioxygenase [Carnobacterium divergens]
MNELKGIHHVTAMTSSAEKNYHFFTEVLGMRLVKKTVNQDDIQTYHTFFADDRGSAGTDMTFFDFPGIPKGTKGTNSISKTSFRVLSDQALDYWLARFDQHNVTHTGLTSQFGNKSIQFVDFDGQQYHLISDEHNPGVPAGIPWQKGPVPYDYAIVGLGPIFLTVSSLDAMRLMLVEVMKMNEIAQEDNAYLFEVGEGGNGGQVIVEHRDDLPQAMEGFGNVHHVAFRVEDRAALEAWISRIQDYSLPQSGYVDRFYFESLYVRVGPHILFEFATDGPGFMQDEPYETMGEKLSLPPFLEAERTEIEKMVRPFDTTRRD